MGGGREGAYALDLGFNIPDEGTKNKSSVACRIRRTPDFFHRCTHRHSVSCLEAFIHLFNKCSPRISNVPGTVLGAGNTAGDKTE